MTRLGFVIDQHACIGCHACTVACKEEHGVELGVFRTWVKYIELGEFPDTSRYFSVLRCNHCDDAPCIEICPVKALFRREDGVVDFDPEQCIGCGACLNACPYDALYIDPESHTAAKCNFCAHRLDKGLRPSCEIVCPTQAIHSGDLDDPHSEVSQLISMQPSQVRAPEQGTLPKVHYVGANQAALDPLQVGGETAYLSTEISEDQQEKLAPLAEEAHGRVTGDINHTAPWGWHVSSYFLAKGVAAGVMMLAAVLTHFGAASSLLAGPVSGLLSLAGIGATGALLVADLKRPDRFYYLFTRPQWRSWLARGAQVINFAALIAVAFTLAAILGWSELRDLLAWLMIPAGAALAGYTAFLFQQCEGRDLWQSQLLLPQTIINAIVAGTAALACIAVIGEASEQTTNFLAWILLSSLLGSIALILSDVFGRHATGQASRAARNLWRDRFALRFWLGGLCLGVVLPVGLLALTLLAHYTAPLAIAAPLVLVGLWFYEDAWVRAGQSVPLS